MSVFPVDEVHYTSRMFVRYYAQNSCFCVGANVINLVPYDNKRCFCNFAVWFCIDMIWVHKILPSTFCLNNIQQSRLISSIQGMFWGTEYYNRTIIDTKLGSTAFQGPGNIGHFCTENELSFLYSQLLSQPSNSEADSDNCIQHSILYSLQDTTDCSGKTPLGT